MFGTRLARFPWLAGLFLAAAILGSPLAGPRVAAQDAKKDEKKDDKKAAAKAKSKLKITVPQDDADLLIENKATKLTGTVREFETPDLETGKLYEYDFAVTWRPNNYTVLTRTAKAEFKGGDDIVVDLTKENPKTPDKAVIRWVPTPDDIVQEMLKMAKITKDDVVFEPGPGDGKVLIAAAKAGAKKCVGIELDPKKAEEAKENVKKDKLEDKVEIRTGDALKVEDYGSSTVMFLYMGNEFNALLRPLLYKQLKPGTRIVSHRFTMGDWAPEKSITVKGEDGDEYKLHLWVVKEKK